MSGQSSACQVTGREAPVLTCQSYLQASVHALERQLADIRHSIARERRAIPQAGCYLVSQGSGWQHSNSVQCTHCRCRCRRCWRPPAVRCSTCSISQRTCRPTCQHLSQAASRGLAKQMQPMLRHRLRHPLRAEKTATPMCQPLRPQRRGNARKPPEGQAAHCTGCAGQRVCHHSLRQPGPCASCLAMPAESGSLPEAQHCQHNVQRRRLCAGSTRLPAKWLPTWR